MLTVNEYFSGNVKSISLETRTLPATIGVMAKGDYTFSTDCLEIMSVVSGELEICQEGSEEWVTYIDGQVFEVPANTKFQVKAAIDTAYLCKYQK